MKTIREWLEELPAHRVMSVIFIVVTVVQCLVILGTLYAIYKLNT